MAITNRMKRNYKNGVIFFGPIFFEFVNQITGDWVNESGIPNIHTGKLITILIGVAYLVQVSVFAWKDKQHSEIIEDLEQKNNQLQKESDTYKESIKSLIDIFGYTTEKIKQQITDYKKNQAIDTYYLNLTNAATIVCEQIFSNIDSMLLKECDITVNYYRKYKEGAKYYTEMIAHEGYETQPKFYKRRKLLKLDNDSYYCERLLSDDNPDCVFLPDKSAVRKAFRICDDHCKYNQYIGIPIQRVGSNEKIALIEIVVHNNSIVWDTQDEVRNFISKYCNQFKEYFLMIDMLSMFYETINKYGDITKRGKNHGKNSEISE